MSTKSLLISRAVEYAEANGCNITKNLGYGTDGMVCQTNLRSVLKALERRWNYDIELRCYQRLRDFGIRNVCGLAIPRLIGWDSDLMVIEMELVSAPCLIDFGKAYLDSPPDFSESTMDYDEREQRELWGERYDDVQTILWSLRQKGIYYCDPKPQNIQFEDWVQ